MIHCFKIQEYPYIYYYYGDKFNGRNGSQRKWDVDMKAFIAQQDTFIIIVNRDLFSRSIEKCIVYYQINLDIDKFPIHSGNMFGKKFNKMYVYPISDEHGKIYLLCILFIYFYWMIRFLKGTNTVIVLSNHLKFKSSEQYKTSLNNINH